MKLISMVEFVLEVTSKKYRKEHVLNQCLQERLKMIAYAKFLKQPLALGMFTPCDKDGNMLEDPNVKSATPMMGDIESRRFDYKEAQQAVLFEGVSFLAFDGVKHHIEQGRTIEYLVPFGVTLTKSAIKQIGL